MLSTVGDRTITISQRNSCHLYDVQSICCTCLPHTACISSCFPLWWMIALQLNFAWTDLGDICSSLSRHISLFPHLCSCAFESSSVASLKFASTRLVSPRAHGNSGTLPSTISLISVAELSGCMSFPNILKVALIFFRCCSKGKFSAHPCSVIVLEAS